MTAPHIALFCNYISHRCISIAGILRKVSNIAKHDGNNYFHIDWYVVFKGKYNTQLWFYECRNKLQYRTFFWSNSQKPWKVICKINAGKQKN